MKNEMLTALQQYYNSTDKATIKKEWQEIENINFEGPNAFDYFEFISHYYTLQRSECFKSNIIIQNQFSSDFSEHFFFRNIAI